MLPNYAPDPNENVNVGVLYRVLVHTRVRLKAHELDFFQQQVYWKMHFGSLPSMLQSLMEILSIRPELV